MRIGMVTGEFPPMEGGVGAFTEQVALALHALGPEVHVITSREARPNDVKRRLSDLNDPYPQAYGYLHPRTGRWRWPTIDTVADIAMRYELDVVNIQYQAAAYNMSSPAINVLPWRLKNILPTAVTFHDLRTPYLLPKAGRIRQLALQFMARQAHGSIATNAQDFSLLSGWQLDKLVEIPIGSNIAVAKVNDFEVSEIRERWSIGDDNILLGYFGFLNESKGADLLIEALAGLDERFHVLFIGAQTGASDDANNQAFKQKILNLVQLHGLTERVHWTGFLREDRVSAHLVAADLIVLPYRDGVSLRRGTLMAALAHGRPVISTTPGRPIADLTHGNNIWLVSPDVATGLADAITTVSGDDLLRDRMGKAAQTVAQNFTWDKVAAKTLTFFEMLLAGDQSKIDFAGGR